MPIPRTRRRGRDRKKQHGGAVYTYTKEFVVTLWMMDEDSNIFNTHLYLPDLDEHEIAQVSAKIIRHFQNYAELLKNAANYDDHYDYPNEDPDPITVLSRTLDVDEETLRDIVNYVDNIRYRHIGGDRFEVTFDINLPDSNTGEPNLGFSNDDKDAQRDNIFGILIEKVENFYSEQEIEFAGAWGWDVIASQHEIDYSRFGRRLKKQVPLTEANQLLIGAEDIGIIPKPAPDQVNALSLAEFENGEDVIIIREAGHDHMYKRDGLLAYFNHRIENNLPLVNPATNNHIINPYDLLSNPPVFDNDIVFKVGKIAPPPAVGGRSRRRRRQRSRQSRRRHSSRI